MSEPLTGTKNRGVLRMGAMDQNRALSVRERDKPEREREFLHPAWRAFISYCAQLQHGEIERLAIQDGIPVLAEMTKKKVKFTS